ncbi:ABC transporter permease [Dietzia sp. ANT_WB102]|uniref:ABC transporter permease n=1 Tax=Dietzia sp. ANT_WB102 TaxID=2597345 RepID=UPI0011EFDB46|nr:ABC transporter permease [Dietzia sp. ANT_WB102]KAA0919008.1 FtsX-like permease family protein [Dietzia sp. ANT_WB102]
MSPHLVLGQLRAHAGRYLGTVLAIAVAVGFVLASVGVLRTMTASADATFGMRYADTDVLVQNLGDRTSAGSDAAREEAAEAQRLGLETIAATPGVRAATVDAQTYVRVRVEGRAQQVTTSTTLASDEGLRWQPLSEGRVPATPGEVAIRSDADLPLGATFEVQPTGEGDPAVVTVVGLFDLSGQPDMKSSFPLYTVDEQVQQWAPNGAAGDIRVAGDGTVPDEALAAEIEQRLGGIPGTSAVEVSTGAAEADALAEAFIGSRDVYSRALLAFTILAVAVAALVIGTTFAVVFAARVRETALLRCLGASRLQLRLSGMAEALLVGTLATAVGLILGRAAVSLAAQEAPRLGVTIPLQEVSVPGSAFLLAAAVGVGVTLATAIPSLWRATSGSPLAALRPADVRPDPWWLRLAMVAVGGAVAMFGWHSMSAAVAARDVVEAGAWGVLAFLGVLAVAAGALPTLLGALGSVVGVLLGPVGLIGARNTARSPRRTAATSAAVVVGVTLTSTMVTGIALLGPAIQARLVDRVPLDIAVTAPGGDLLPENLPRTLAELPGVIESSVVTDMYAEDPQGKRTVLRVAEPERIGNVMRREVVLPGPGEIVLPESSPVAARARDGDTVRFTFFSDDDARDLVVRRTSDQWALAAPGSVPAWPVAQLPDGSPWPDEVELPARFVPRTEMWLRMDDSLDHEQLEAALQGVRSAVVEAAPDLAVTESFASREQIATSVRTVLTSSSLLLAVAVALALVGVANTLTLAVRERTREIALLRGVGVTRTGVWLMLVLETLLVAACAAALGVALGAAFGTAGATALAGAGTGLGSGVFSGLTGIGNEGVPVVDLVKVGVGGVLAAVVAAAVAALGAVRSRVGTG